MLPGRITPGFQDATVVVEMEVDLISTAKIPRDPHIDKYVTRTLQTADTGTLKLY